MLFYIYTKYASWSRSHTNTQLMFEHTQILLIQAAIVFLHLPAWYTVKRSLLYSKHEDIVPFGLRECPTFKCKINLSSVSPYASSYSLFRKFSNLATAGLDIPSLQKVALEHIKESLTPDNIVTELSSAFTSRFPEVQKIQKAYLLRHWVGFSIYINKKFRS